MTKYFEEFIRTDIDILDTFNLDIKGELTVVISENKSYKETNKNLTKFDKELIKSMINKLSVKEITTLINYSQKKISKKIIYDYCISLKNDI